MNSFTFTRFRLGVFITLLIYFNIDEFVSSVLSSWLRFILPGSFQCWDYSCVAWNSSGLQILALIFILLAFLLSWPLSFLRPIYFPPETGQYAKIEN